MTWKELVLAGKARMEKGYASLIDSAWKLIGGREYRTEDYDVR